MRRLVSLLLAATAVLASLAIAGDGPVPLRDERGWTVVEGGVAVGMAEVLAGFGPFSEPALAVSMLGGDATAADLNTLVTGPTLLFYYSASCPHCQQVAPEIVRLAQEFEGRVAFVGIASGNNSLSEIRAFTKDYGLPFVTYKDFTRKFASANDVASTPTVMIVQPREGGGFESLAEYRPFPGGYGIVAEIRIRAALGEDPFGAFEPGRYVGTQGCASCHVQEYASWGLTWHSVAYWTLYEREEAENPKCVGCHVVGFGKETGFQSGDHGSALADVGCEACHGPAGPHAGDSAQNPREACVGCHDAEHSIRFDLGVALPHVDHFVAATLAPEEFVARREALLEGRAERPLLAFPAGANLGSGSCEECHVEESRSWAKGPHAGAYKTLKQRKSHKDVGCVRCHGVARVDAPAKPADWYADGVGCEACHGPGEQHVAAKGGTENVVGLGKTCAECIIEAVCTRCHTPEHDSDFELKGALDRLSH